MKWSELPKEYRDLIDGLSDDEKKQINYVECDTIFDMFSWQNAERICNLPEFFFGKCDRARTISELPKIPLTIKE